METRMQWTALSHLGEESVHHVYREWDDVPSGGNRDRDLYPMDDLYEYETRVAGICGFWRGR